MPTLLTLLRDAVEEYGDQDALGSRGDDGAIATWSYREFDRRTRIAAWRLRRLGLKPGDRVLTWSPSSPDLAATYFGAMRARLILADFPSEVAGCSRMTGWIEQIAQLTSVRDLNVEKTKCFAKGDAECEWRVSWK